MINPTIFAVCDYHSPYHYYQHGDEGCQGRILLEQILAHPLQSDKEKNSRELYSIHSIELLASLKVDGCFFASTNVTGYLIAVMQPLLTIWISVP